MCVQNVPFKTREEGRKRALERELRFYEDLGLSVGFVPLCADSRPLTVRCPFCGLVMLDVPNKDSYDYFCPECGWMA
jgi:hypothetical protein